jgi:ElaB/YqjD/DUF883 family membrane-anchored ribosome-binding protein
MALKELVRDKSVERAAETIDALAERAKELLYDMARRARDTEAKTEAKEAREGAWRFAAEARDQASELAGDLYERGQRTVAVVGRRVEEQPYVALLVVAFFGIALGYMMRRR